MEKTYKIEVDCANCAAIIVRNVAKLKCVREVTVSYMAQKMLVEYAPGVDEAEAKAEILKTARKVEPDFRFGTPRASIRIPKWCLLSRSRWACRAFANFLM